MAAEDSIWTSKDILGAIVATGLISAAASWVVDLIRSAYARRKAARYGAMRCAVALENFAADCWHITNMAEGHFSVAEDAYSDDLPSAPILPEDIDWKSLDSTLSDRILSFVTSIKLASSEAAYSRAFEGNPFDFDGSAKSLGLQAVELANTLRTAYGMMRSPEYERMKKRFC